MDNMMDEPLIAFTGCAGSGKDTAAHWTSLYTLYPVYALSSPVKELAHVLIDDSSGKNDEVMRYMTNEKYSTLHFVYHKYGFQKYESFDSFFKFISSKIYISLDMYVTSPRIVYQVIGTDWGRRWDPMMWIRMAPNKHIISDVRFDNEALYFKSLGYTIIKITRDNIISMDHESEHGIDNQYIDYTLHNNGKITDLYGTLIKVITTVKGDDQ